MRTSYRRQRSGFTLMELLVVIAIIGILAAILFPAITSALKRAEINRAKADMMAIASAIRAYRETYSIWPVPFNSNGYPDWTYGRKSGAAREQNLVMNILRGLDTTNNPQRIVFLEVGLESMQSAADKEGAAYDASDGFYIDPWGTPYMIVMDTDFDNEVGGIAIDQPAMDYVWNELSPQGDATFPGVTVGVMSYGPNPEDPPNSFLKSW